MEQRVGEHWNNFRIFLFSVRIVQFIIIKQVQIEFILIINFGEIFSLVFSDIFFVVVVQLNIILMTTKGEGGSGVGGGGGDLNLNIAYNILIMMMTFG